MVNVLRSAPGGLESHVRLSKVKNSGLRRLMYRASCVVALAESSISLQIVPTVD